MSNFKLISYCYNLGTFLSNDIDGEGLYKELQLIKLLIPKTGGASACLNTIFEHNLEDTYTISTKAFKIACILHTSVAKNERSNSKLKLIKSYLRSNMGQDTFNDCALLSIESEVADKIDCSEIYGKLTEENVMNMPHNWVPYL